ncbi:MAG: NUDIX domain-containing protein [candidate division Zixibacteria bacterium]|nr:NUDIX domain-containing protein [candidate division Zixibacteria bacterium]
MLTARIDGLVLTRMYISKENLQEFERLYGRPEELFTSFQMNPREYQNLLDSQKHNRSHDVTIFIRKDDKWVVNAKPWYPEGLYRIPSGGIRPDESLAAGAQREAFEETGSRIDILRYFLRIFVRFYSDNRSVDWVSHLILTDWKAGELRPVDTVEIKKVHLAERSEFERFGRIMLKLDVGGLHYREYLHRQAFKILDALDD